METNSPDTPLAEATLALVGNQNLVISREGETSVLRIVGGDGAVSLTVTVTPEGPVLRFDGGAIRIETTGDLAFAARRIALHGEEGLAITTGGDATLSAVGTLTTEGRAQVISARRGDVAVHANDDVKLEGERIRLNC